MTMYNAKPFLILPLVVCCLKTEPLSAATQARAAIVDLHCHIAGIGAGGSGCYISPKLRSSFRYKTYLKAFGVTDKQLQEKGDQIAAARLAEKLSRSRYVSAAVLLAIDGVVGSNGTLDWKQTEIYVPNEFVREQAQRHTNFYYAASINPYRQDAIERLNHEASLGAKFIKWLPNIQQIDPADPQLVPFYQNLKRLGLPLLVHTGTEHSFTVSRNEYGDPLRLGLALEQGVTVIAAHAASLGRTEHLGNMDRLISLIEQYPNLYIDISAMTQINRAGHLRRLLRRKQVLDRLVYGTDMPLLETPLVSPLFSICTLGPVQTIRLFREKNPWDRDVLYKRALGVPEPVFFRSAELLQAQFGNSAFP